MKCQKSSQDCDSFYELKYITFNAIYDQETHQILPFLNMTGTR